MTKIRYVIDTNGLIAYFDNIFKSLPNYEGSPEISEKVKSHIYESLYSIESKVLLSVPSIVFIEIYEKWLRSEEFYKKFFYEVFVPIKQSPNIEIRGIDQEVLENLLLVDGCLSQHDLHDKIVVASAMTLECPIITFDNKIIEFVKNDKKKIPKVIN